MWHQKTKLDNGNGSHWPHTDPIEDMGYNVVENDFDDIDDVHVILPTDESPVIRGWRSQLARRLRAMGEAVKVPDKQGIFIPTTLAVMMLTMLGTLGGVFYRAGQIVQNQNVQEAARLQMNQQWHESLNELKEDLEAVKEIRATVGGLDGRITTIEDSMAQFTKESIEERATLRATQDEIRRDMQTQEREHRLLKDYTEGRIGGLPYRPPSG